MAANSVLAQITVEPGSTLKYIYIFDKTLYSFYFSCLCATLLLGFCKFASMWDQSGYSIVFSLRNKIITTWDCVGLRNPNTWITW